MQSTNLSQNSNLSSPRHGQAACAFKDPFRLGPAKNAKRQGDATRAIQAAYLGEDPGDLSALENPDTVDEIAKLKGR